MALKMTIEQVTNAIYVTGRKEFRNADLSGLDLSDAPLAGADFTGCVLTGTKFTGAELTGAKFGGANARRANFRGAKLAKANLSGAFLEGAQFPDADVTDADFSKSDLHDVRVGEGFRSAKLDGTWMNNKPDGLVSKNAPMTRPTLNVPVGTGTASPVGRRSVALSQF